MGRMEAETADQKQTCHLLNASGMLDTIFGAQSSVYGWDEWHWERGLSRKRQELLLDVLKDDLGAEQPADSQEELEHIFVSDRLTCTTRSTPPIKAIGRAAWAVGSDELGPVDARSECHCRSFLDLNPHGYLYNIGHTGEVHYCPFYASIPLGNIFEEPMERILRAARRDPALRLLSDTGDILEFAVSHCHMSSTEAQQILQRSGRCLLHQEALMRYYAKDPGRRPVFHGIFEQERGQSNAQVTE